MEQYTLSRVHLCLARRCGEDDVSTQFRCREHEGQDLWLRSITLFETSCRPKPKGLQ